MRQKVGIAIAMAKQAKVLLLDEPLSGLDPKAANEFCQILIRLKDNGVAILMATHDLFRAKEIGDRLGIMKDGDLLETLHTKDVSLREIEDTYLNHMQTFQEAN
jgi:ABC-2 type transport system ATP-binding protein